MINAAIILADSLAAIPDPRSRSRVRYRLADVLFLTVSAVMAGCDGWEEIEDFGTDNLEWLKKFTRFDRRSPSADTVRRVFSRVSPRAFRICFSTWASSVFGDKIGGHIAIDGKCLRGSATDKKAAMTLLSAFATEHGICLAQQAVDSKSNEITGMPNILDAIDISGSLVSIDAMGCQESIVDKIVSKKGDYLIAVKGNQKALLRDVEASFDHFQEQFDLQIDTYQTKERSHGRHEIRDYAMISDVAWIPEGDRWTGIKSIIKADSETVRKETTSKCTRYFICSRADGIRDISTAIRRHWAIENELHWVLDVAFNEDSIGVHDRWAAQNLALVRKISLALTKVAKPKNMSYRRQGKRYGRRPDLLFKTLSDQAV